MCSSQRGEFTVSDLGVKGLTVTESLQRQFVTLYPQAFKESFKGYVHYEL